jgi:predicted outer membrane lipoprotein
MTLRLVAPGFSWILRVLLAPFVFAAFGSVSALASGLACVTDGDCEDAQGCTGTETCDPLLFVCLAGTPPDCDDGNDCTFDTCLEPGYCGSAAVADGAACDDGVVCSYADACESGTCRSGGSDVDQSGVCDQDEAGNIAVSSAELKAQKDGNAAGQVAAKAAFVTAPPLDAVDVGQPVTVVIQDLGSRGAGHTFAVGDCVTKGSGIRCRSVDRSANVSFRPDRDVVDGVRLTAKFRRLAIAGPFAGPLTVSLTYGAGTVRFGSNATCAGDGTGIRCR